MIRRLFPTDKNYILGEVQASQKDSLLQYLVQFVKQYYLQNHNPLGLVDDTIIEIQKNKEFPVEAFDDFYHDLAAIYRFKHGEVQLEFLFDGSSHSEKYIADWVTFYKQNIRAFCLNRYFIRAVLDLSVFHNHDRVAYLAGDRLKYFLSQYYAMKVYKYKGIMSVSAQA
jgi:hypothetical protein